MNLLIDDVSTLSWLYTLFTSIDACFRVKRYDVSNETKDPIIDDGLSYFVKNEPYKKELAKYGDQDEVSLASSLSLLPLSYLHIYSRSVDVRDLRHSIMLIPSFRKAMRRQVSVPVFVRGTSLY